MTEENEKKYEYYDAENDTYAFRGEVLKPMRVGFKVFYQSESYRLVRYEDGMCRREEPAYEARSLRRGLYRSAVTAEGALSALDLGLKEKGL